MFALYVHWPFCKSKCPYCDFNSHVRDGVDHARWQQALLDELEQSAKILGPQKLNSIFFGGGTPTLMAPATVGAIIERATQLWSPADDIEITMEANPTSVEAGRFKDYAAAGVNRVSIGVQSLLTADLKMLGREHSVAEAKSVIDLAAKTFPRYSFDMIYARPHQSSSAWEAELQDALSMAGDHLSLYQLTIEPGTAFHTQYRLGELVIPDEDAASELYELTQDIMTSAGLPQYEISNHARPGQESRHNLTYWRYGDYAGIGPGAHGRVTIEGKKFATTRQRLPETWLKLVEENSHALVEQIEITQNDQLKELLLMGLRLEEGIPLTRIEDLTGKPLKHVIDKRRLDDLVEGGFILYDQQILRVTSAGRQRLNAVLLHLLA